MVFGTVEDVSDESSFKSVEFTKTEKIWVKDLTTNKWFQNGSTSFMTSSYGYTILTSDEPEYAELAEQLERDKETSEDRAARERRNEEKEEKMRRMLEESSDDD